MSNLYVTAGFSAGFDDAPARIRMQRTAKYVHVSIDALTVVLDVDTARALRDQLTAELGEPS